MSDMTPGRHLDDLRDLLNLSLEALDPNTTTPVSAYEQGVIIGKREAYMATLAWLDTVWPMRKMAPPPGTTRVVVSDDLIITTTPKPQEG